MSNINQTLSQLVANTRKQWISTIVRGYRIKVPNIWKYYGYKSEQSFYEDLID